MHDPRSALGCRRFSRRVRVTWRVLDYLAGLPGWMSRDLVVRGARTAGSVKAGCRLSHDLYRRVMFARVITAQAGAEGFDNAIRLAQQQLPGAGSSPGSRASTFSPTVRPASSSPSRCGRPASRWRRSVEAVRPVSTTRPLWRWGSPRRASKPTKSRCRAEPPRSDASPGVPSNQPSRCGAPRDRAVETRSQLSRHPACSIPGWAYR